MDIQGFDNLLAGSESASRTNSEKRKLYMEMEVRKGLG
jgi:hypothetical protein